MINVDFVPPEHVEDLYRVFVAAGHNLAQAPEGINIANIYYGWLLSSEDGNPAVLFGAYVDDVLVGFLSLDCIDKVNQSAKIGTIAVDPVLAPQFCGVRMAGVVLKYAFEVLDLNRLYAHTWSDNPKMTSIYRRFGATKEGHERQQTRKGDKWVDRIIWGLLKEEYHG
jgi:RimJ/RimL family protein N-acetyltransferase